MRRVLGQAWTWTHRLCALALVVLLVGLAGLGGLAWRLAEHPLEVPWLAARIEAAVNAAPGGARLSLGRAAIAWEGFRSGTGAPIDIRLEDVRVAGPAGEALDLPEMAVTLSAGALLRGIVAPATIELRRPRLRLVLTPAGTLAFGRPAEPAEPDAADAPDPLAVLAGLMLPASDADALSALRRLRIAGGEITLADPAQGREWSLIEPQVDLRRAAGGGLSGQGEGVMRAGGVSVPVHLTGAATGAPMRLSVGLILPALRPAQLAQFWPALAPLAALDAPVALSAFLGLDADGRPDALRARLEAGGGALLLGGGRLPVAGLTAEVEGGGRALRVLRAELRLPGAAGSGPGTSPGPSLSSTGEVRQDGTGWVAGFDLTADGLAASALPRLWPSGLAEAWRAQLLPALPAGELREARARIALTMPAGTEVPTLAEAQLRLRLDRAVVDFGPGRRVAAELAEVQVQLTPESLRLDRVLLRLPATGGSAAPVLTAEGSAARRDGRWRFTGAAQLNAVTLAALPTHWPADIAPGARWWITTNVTAGEIRNGRWQVAGSVAETLDDPVIDALSGSAEFSDLTMHWLRPIPPVRGLAGTAEFGLNTITLRSRGGRQAPVDASGRGSIELRESTARFHALDAPVGQVDITLQLAGSMVETAAVLRHPRLKLLDRRRFDLNIAGGTAEAQLAVGMPLLADLPMEELRLRASARITEGRVIGALLGRDLDRGALDLNVDLEGLRVQGTAQLLGSPVRLGVELDFKGGGPAQVTERATLAGRLDQRQLGLLGIDTLGLMDGPAAFETRYERRRNGQATVAVRGDLEPARLGFAPLQWLKPPGTAASGEALLRLQGDTLLTMDSYRVEAPGLELRGRAAFGPGARLERLEVASGRYQAARFTGELRRPERGSDAWRLRLQGPVVDLRPLLAADPDPPAAAAAPEPATGPQTRIAFDFDRATNGEGRELHALRGEVRLDSRGLLREARLDGRTAPAAGAGDFQLALTPQGNARSLRLTAEDGGALLYAFDVVQSIRGGKLEVNAIYPELRANAPLQGTAELESFVLRDAPAIAKLMQAITVYGLVEAVQGGNGLVFARAIVPFTLTPEALVLRDARAFSASLGLTAQGRVLRRAERVDVEGTIVPAYMFNTLLGNLPLVGRLFSPERGGGVFAATYRMRGPSADPSVTVNPLAALTPGFLRGIFGLGRTAAGTP